MTSLNTKVEEQIKKELEKNFKSIDLEVLNYLIGEFLLPIYFILILHDREWIYLNQGVIELNKEDFSTTEDIQEAIGAILGELSNGENDEEFIFELCSKFLDILQW